MNPGESNSRSFLEVRTPWLIGLAAVLFTSALVVWSAPWRAYSDLHPKRGNGDSHLVPVTWEPRGIQTKVGSERQKLPMSTSFSPFPNKPLELTTIQPAVDGARNSTAVGNIGDDELDRASPPEPFKGPLRNCLSGTNLIFFGHSHVRYLYEALCQRLAQLPELAGSIPHGTCEKRSVLTKLQFKQWNDFRFHFLSSPFWEVDDSTWDDLLSNNLNLNGPLHIVFARGAWDLIYNNTDPIDFYKQSVQRLRRVVAKASKATRGKRKLLLSIYLSHYYHQPTKATYQQCTLDSRNQVYRDLTRCAAAEVSRVTPRAKDSSNSLFKFLDVYSWTKNLPRVEADGWGHHYSRKITNSIVDQYLSEILCHEGRLSSREQQQQDAQENIRTGSSGAREKVTSTSTELDCQMDNPSNETQILWRELFDQRHYRNCTCHRSPFGLNCPVWAQFIDPSAKTKLMKEKVRREILQQLCEEWNDSERSSSSSNDSSSNVPSMDSGQGIVVELCAPHSKESLRACLRQVPGLALAELVLKLKTPDSAADPTPASCRCANLSTGSREVPQKSDAEDCAHRLKGSFCLREPVLSLCQRWLPPA